MIFRHETDMQAPVRSWLDSQGFDTKTEFTTPWGVCDLVGVAFNEDHVAKRLSHDQRRAIGPSSRVALLHVIPDCEQATYVTLQGLSTRFNGVMQPDRLRQELDYLVQSNFVVCPRQNAFQRVNGWLPMHRRIVAVELKLSRVLEAMSQAFSHLVFAPESFVALPKDLAIRVNKDERRTAFETLGLGLLSVGSKSCSLLIEPRSSKDDIDPVLQVAFVERFWSGQLTGSSS